MADLNVPLATPPATPPAPEFGAISDLLGKLNESVSGLDERLNGFEETLAAITTPPPPPPTKEPEWKPQTWDEFPLKAKEVARQTFAELEAEKQTKQEQTLEQQKELQTQIDKDFDEQLSKLEKEGTIPPVANVADPNDKGKQARKELFALGIKYGTADLVAMANLRNDYTTAGYSFDPKEGKLIRSNPRPFGADAPVGSSARNVASGNKPTYKEIHGLSMDEMIRRFNT